MANIRKRGNRYQVQVRRKGQSSATRSFTRLSDAKEWARLIETQADRQELAPNRKALEKTKLSTLVKRYKQDVVPTLRAADREMYVLDAFLRHPICNKTLASLSVTDFAKYRDERLQTVTAKSLKRTLSPINHMFELAREEWGIPLKENPLAKLRLNVTDDKRQRRLRKGELALLLENAASGPVTGRGNHSNRQRNGYLPLVIQFALETAMRQGEILALRWGQVDLERASLTVLESKNGYSRVIPVTNTAASVLMQARELSGAGDNPEPDTMVFPVEANAVKLSWQRLLKRCGITDLHFHDLRHEAISRLFELGLTVPEVASISGHRDMTMLMRYAHANQTRVRAKLGVGISE